MKAYVIVNFNIGKIYVVDVETGINLMWFTNLDRAEAYAAEINTRCE